MIVNLDISQESLDMFEELAKKNKRSRKAFMEFILENHASKESDRVNNLAENNLVFASPNKDSYDAEKINRIVHDEIGQWQEPIKDYAYYERLAKSVEYDNAENLIKEIFSSPLKVWQKPMLQKIINERFSF